MYVCIVYVYIRKMNGADIIVTTNANISTSVYMNVCMYVCMHVSLHQGSYLALQLYTCKDINMSIPPLSLCR